MIKEIKLLVEGKVDDINDCNGTILRMMKGYNLSIIESSCKPFVEEEKSVIISPPKLETRSTMDVNEAAEYLGLSIKTVYTYANKKILPHYKLGSRVQFKREELDVWIESRRINEI